MFNDPEVLARLKSTRGDIFTQLPENLDVYQGSNKAQTISKTNLEADDFKNPIKKASKGYIPNFANKALADSINRERVESGLPISAISVTQDNRLMNSRNPTGLAVINSRDEPNGKIPNFAAPQPLTAADFGNASKALGVNLDDLNKKIKELASQVSRNSKTEIEAKAELDKHIASLRNFNSKNVSSTLANSKSLANIQTVAGGQLSNSVQTKTEKGFGDLVGKIFLFQTALSFATGAAGDLESSTAKLTAKLSETATNVASFGLLGQQLMESNPASALGKFGKNLGLVGLGAGVLYEGFKLADFAIKEFSGENAKVATSLSKLNDASKLLAIKFEDLSETRQLDIKTKASNVLGSEGFKGFLGTIMGSVKGGGEIGGDPKVQQGIANLLAQGATEKEIKSILAQGKQFKTTDKYDSYGQYRGKITEETTQLSDILAIIEKNTSGGLGQQLSEKNRQFRVSTAGLDMSSQEGEKLAKEKAALAYGGKNFASLPQERKDVIEEELKKQREANKLARDSADIENATNLGKRLALDIAKLEVNNAVELRRKTIERSDDEEDSIKLRMAAINLTNEEKIALESKLKAIELEKKLRVDILEIAKGGVDKALEGNIKVTVDKLNEMKKVLETTDLSKIDFSKPNTDLTKLKDSLIAVSGIGEAEAQSVIDSIDKQINGKKTIYNFDVETNKLLQTQAILADEVKQKYESQLYAITRIAALAKSTADLNVSGISSEKAVIGSQISTLEDSNTNPYSGVLDKRANEKEILNLKLQQFQLDKQINAENRSAESIAVDKEIAAKKFEQNTFMAGRWQDPNFSSDANTKRAKELEDQLKTLENKKSQLPNEINAENTALETNISLLEKRIALFDKRGTFKEGLSSGLQELENSTLDFQNTLGKEIPQLFSSNLAQGLNDAISGAKSLKEALTDAATSFLNAITQKNIQNLADMFTGGVGRFFTKNKTNELASGGMISGGSGTKDDVPAMLMGGEYVVKKSAVQKYGSSFLDSLNKGKISGYAAGGGVQSGSGGFYAPGEYGQGAITGQRQLLDFANQSSTSGQFDQMGSYGMTGASINLEAESGRLTMAGRENSPMFERVQQAKEEAFQVYLQSLQVDKQYQDQLKEIKDAEKARKKKLVTSIAMAVATTAASAAASGFSNAYGASAGKGFFSRIGSGLSGAVGKGGMTGEGGLGNLFSGNFSSAFNNLNVGFQKPTGYSSGISNIGESLNSNGIYKRGEYKFNNSTGVYDTVNKRASGGMVNGGSGVRDDVPAMLTGGEFVLNNRATKKLGMSNLNRLNSGDTGSQQGSSDLTQALISKLDELISATEKTGGDSVVVNVSGTDTQGEKNESSKSSNERDLQRKIKAAVLEVITQEKRLGGSLNK